MGRILALLVAAAALVSVGSTKASAWTCYATGLGSGGSAVLVLREWVLRDWEPAAPARLHGLVRGCRGSSGHHLRLVGLLSRLIDEAFRGDPGLAGSFPSSPPARGAPTESLVKFVPDRPGHDRRYAMDGSKIARELGFHPQESLESGLRRTITWYLQEQPWWRSVMDGSYRAWISTQYGGGAA